MKPGRWFIAAAFILMIVCAYFYGPPYQAENPALVWGDIALLAGGLLLGAGLWLLREGLPGSIRAIRAESRPARWKIAAAGIGCLILVGERSAAMFSLDIVMSLDSHFQVVLLIIGLGCLGIGLTGALPRSMPLPKKNWAPVLILLLAFALRTWNLETGVHLLVDEAHMVDAVNHLRAIPETAIMRPFNPFAAFSWLYPYAEALSTEIMGSTLSALRMVSVTVGTLTVAAVYLLGKRLFDRQTALISMLLLATFPPHIHFSRLALLNAADPLIGTLAVYFLARAVGNGTRRDYVLAGLMSGLLIYFHEAGKLLFPALILLWILWLLVMGSRRPTLRGLSWMSLAAILAALPFLMTLYQTGAPFFPRFEDRNAGKGLFEAMLYSPGALENLQGFFRVQVMPALQHLFYQPDGSRQYYLGDFGLVLPWLVPFFLMGVAHAFWRPRAGGILLLLWVLLTVMGNSLLNLTNNSARFVVAFPALALLMSVGLVYTARPILPRRMLSKMMIGVALLLAGTQMVYYFAAHLPRFNVQARIRMDYIDAAFRAANLPEETRILFLFTDTVYVEDFDILFKFWGERRYFEAVPFQIVKLDALLALDPAQDYAFFIDPRDSGRLSMLRRVWELRGPYLSPYNVPPDRQYHLYLAPSGSRRRMEVDP